MTITPEIEAKWSKEWDAVELSITWRADPDCGSIEFFIDGKSITTWSYDGHPHDALEEFRDVVKVGFILGRSTIEIELPKLIEGSGASHVGHSLGVQQCWAHIESHGYRVKGESHG